MDCIQIIGVDSKGYGKIYKSIMRNRTIPVQGKAIYAYMCSFAGSGTTAFPKRDRILRDLQIGKNAYSKYMKQLVDAGFIRRMRTPTGNVYELSIQVTTPEGEVLSVAANGYGTVPKLVMQDATLSIQAKGIYAYFCSYTGAGNKCYPKRATILRDLDMCESAYYRHYHLLVENGFVNPVKGSNNGRFDVSTYNLVEFLPMSPKTGLGKKGDNNAEFPPMSPFSGSGGNVDNSDSDRKAMSPRTASGKTMPGDWRQANNNNSSNSNICNLSITEEKSNIGDDLSTSLKIGKQQVKDLIGYKMLLAEAEAAGNLKTCLGHFGDEEERKRYVFKHTEIVKEFSRQIYQFYLRTSLVVEIDGKLYDTIRMKQALLSRLEFDSINELCCELAGRYQSIRSVREYVKRVVLNLAAENVLPNM